MTAETAHNLALKVLQGVSGSRRALSVLEALCPRPSFPTPLGGCHFPNPIGLAAGFDKNGRCAPALAAMGFGFITIGTVTPLPQQGNPPPRLTRDRKRKALWNHLGFPGEGVVAMVELLKDRPALAVPMGISIGKGFNTPLEGAIYDYLYCVEKLAPYASFLEICLSSPNTAGLRSLQREEYLDDFLRWLAKATEKPLWIKLSPDLTPGDLNTAVGLCKKHLNPERDAIIMGNTTTMGLGEGGNSGRPLFARALAQVTAINTELTLVGCGGIYTGQDILSMMLDGGCHLVQLYSAVPFRGPFIVRKLFNEMKHGL